ALADHRVGDGETHAIFLGQNTLACALAPLNLGYIVNGPNEHAILLEFGGSRAAVPAHWCDSVILNGRFSTVRFGTSRAPRLTQFFLSGPVHPERRPYRQGLPASYAMSTQSFRSG